jgi:predicted permease
MKRLRSFLRAAFGRARFEESMTEELQFHVAQYTEDLVRSGVAPQEARRRARMEFGGVDNVREDCREARGLRLTDEFARNLKHALRGLRRRPGFTAAALLTLAICTGANLTIFAAIDSILLRPLPFPDAGRLVTIFNTYPKAGVERDGSSITNYYERRGKIPALEAIALYRQDTAITGETGATRREPAMRVSPDFFATLGSGPALGRSFTEDETTVHSDQVVILTDAYWRHYFAADQGALGGQLRVDGAPHRIVGILPPRFQFLSSDARLFLPFSSSAADREPAQRHSGGNVKHMIGRLRAGASVAQAQAQIDAQNAALERDGPQARMMAKAGFRSVVAPLHADYVAGIRPVLLALQAGALVLLLIGAVNLANLLLIGAQSRAKEMAVRQALGAGSRHVWSEAIFETTVLTVGGGLLGLAVAAFGIRLLAALGAGRLPLGNRIALDAGPAVLALLGAVALGLALAAPIAWFYLQTLRKNGMRSEARGLTAGPGAQRLRHAFMAAQVALAMILLTGAGLVGLSLERAMAVAPGFRPDHVLAAQLSLPGIHYPTWTARLAFNERLLREIARQPGVSAAGAANNIPLSGNSGKSAVTVKGHVRRPGESPRGHYVFGVDGDYFAALGIALREGRFLSAGDSRAGRRVCVVDEDFARYYWPDGSAIGQHLFAGPNEGDERAAFTVVGVTGAAKQADLTEETAQGAVYFPYGVWTDERLFVVLRTSLSPEAFAPALQAAVRRIDPEFAASDVRSMNERIADSLLALRSPALIAGIFSAIALLLTALGTYGVLSYAVSQRRREIGVRMAVGARPGQIRAQFLWLAVRLLAFGAAPGLAGAWMAGRAMRTLLFHVPPVHAATLAGAAGMVAVVTLGACLIPARRAARISPMEAIAE